MAGDDNKGKRKAKLDEPPLHFEPVHSGHANIGNKATRVEGGRCHEEFLG